MKQLNKTKTKKTGYFLLKKINKQNNQKHYN